MKKKNRIWFAVLVIVILGSAAAYYAVTEFNRKADSMETRKAAYRLTAITLLQEFSTNEIAATEKYNGKILMVEGLVKSIDQDEQGFYTVVLGDTSSLSSVRCSIDTLRADRVKDLQIHTTITVKGVCTGFNADEMGLGADVLMNRCISLKK